MYPLIVTPSTSSKVTSRRKRKHAIKQQQKANKGVVKNIQWMDFVPQIPSTPDPNVIIGTCSPTQAYPGSHYVSSNYEKVEMSVRDAEKVSHSDSP